MLRKNPHTRTPSLRAGNEFFADDSHRAQVTIGFNKSVSDGVNLYSKRASEAAFTFLARDTESPYVDNRANPTAAPETRDYYGLYVLHDSEIGDQSDTAQAVCKG